MNRKAIAGFEGALILLACIASCDIGFQIGERAAHEEIASPAAVKHEVSTRWIRIKIEDESGANIAELGLRSDHVVVWREDTSNDDPANSIVAKR